MSSAAYWTERVRRYGHTGWSDAATYWYDQRLRLKVAELESPDRIVATAQSRLVMFRVNGELMLSSATAISCLVSAPAMCTNNWPSSRPSWSLRKS